jgi:two-component system chemotaxis response regulator CheB
LSGTPISVLVVDDSAMMRSLVGRIVESGPGTSLAGKAMHGAFALKKLETLDPDVIVLDLEMPVMNGIEFLKERKRRGIAIPVIVLSSIAKKGAQVTMEALALGASDFILKPSGSVSSDIHIVAEKLLQLIRSLGSRYRLKRGGKPPVPVVREYTELQTQLRAKPPPVKPIEPGIQPGRIELVAIGVSTGGPNALRKVFAQIGPELPVPVVIVQHMPPGFTSEFAKSLDRVCPLAVKEAKDGDLLTPGSVLIAPGDRHIVVTRRSGTPRVELRDDGLRNGHRPSADVLFASVAAHYRNHALGVIMTGMGKDGAVELGTMRRTGSITIGQDAESSVVYGMPKVAYEMGHVMQQVSLKEMADTILRIVTEHR